MSLTKILKAILGDNFRPRDDEFISPQVTIWYLRRRSPAEDLTDFTFELQQTTKPDADWYRSIYKAVGGPWLWWERIAMTDETFYSLFAKQDRLVLTPIVDGVEAGFSELLFCEDKPTEIVYFGLKPEFTGDGLAHVFMEKVVRIAQSKGATEVRLNTCSLDHPRARNFYKKRGYEEYDRVEGPVHIPKGLLDPELIQSRL